MKDAGAAYAGTAHTLFRILASMGATVGELHCVHSRVLVHAWLHLALCRFVTRHLDTVNRTLNVYCKVSGDRQMRIHRKAGHVSTPVAAAHTWSGTLPSC